MALVHFLNIELSPDSRSSYITVNFNWPGTEPRVIEQEVTSKLEALFAQVKGIKGISSTSGNEKGTVILSLDKEADKDAVRFETSSLIRQAWPEMPEGATFPLVSLKPAGPGETSSPSLHII
jgi:multidrug efflux pump subunit AcrB